MQLDSKKHGEECDALVSHSRAAHFNIGFGDEFFYSSARRDARTSVSA